MELSIFLAKIMGAYMVLTGLSALVKRKWLMQAVKQMARSSHIIYVIAAFELVVGLALVLSHNVWDGSWRVVVTIFGWLTLLEGIFYLFVRQSVVAKLLGWFSRADWFYTLISLASIVIGGYLVYQGFFIG